MYKGRRVRPGLERDYVHRAPPPRARAVRATQHHTLAGRTFKLPINIFSADYVDYIFCDCACTNPIYQKYLRFTIIT